jgi:hypothetical protein
MKNLIQIHEIPLNIGFRETVARIFLIMPTAFLGVFFVVMYHSYILIQLPGYLLVTGLLSYDPFKHLYRIIRHRQLFSSDPYLHNDMIGDHILS